MKLQQLKEIYNSCVEYRKYLAKNKCMSNRNDVSEYWKEILHWRNNFPSFKEMLKMRQGSTDPLETGKRANYKYEYKYARSCYSVWSKSVPESYLSNLKENDFGLPLRFDINGQRLSAGAIFNALTSYRVIEWCKKRGLFNRPLRILEIGAGYGQMAYQLLHNLNIKNYTICDLPENLFLSSFYLGANFLDRPLNFLKEDDLGKDNLAGFVFLVPPFVKNLSGEYDLIINSHSFQEMNLQSVNEYFELAQKTITPDGIFYSLNAHRKAGVIYPSDYQVERFNLVSFSSARKLPHHFIFATNPYEMILTKLTTSQLTGNALNNFKQQFDALGFMLQLGLDYEISDLYSKFTEFKLNHSEILFLGVIYKFIHSPDYADKKKLLIKMRQINILMGIIAFLEGSLEFAMEHQKEAAAFLEDALNKLVDSSAKARCYIMLSCLTHKSGEKVAACDNYAKAEEILPHLSVEILGWRNDYYGLINQVAYQLYLALPEPPTFWKIQFGRVKRKLIHMRDRER